MECFRGGMATLRCLDVFFRWRLLQYSNNTRAALEEYIIHKVYVRTILDVWLERLLIVGVPLQETIC